ncbi:Membrane protein involved in the export of O-antigen and teichoic acid [Prevotella sp. ne3005]|uniref:oligosaccharide flippase family protein n=1 Tax=Prevotella sp. ne3005 TaxID=1761887 RepID=UPI0008C500CE|nr:oligosaccharide flippase family protein [Prevotella sp. ne3005]SEM66455.1 Membrane protein involved in the export of O-antigen and teichoic acid [Prevotella sp. ne3005]
MAKENDELYSHVLKFTGLFGGVQGLNVVIGLVRNKFVALLLGPGGMGLVSLFNTTVQLISQATHLGISFSAVRHISEYYDAENTEKVAHYVKVVRGWCLLTALVGMLVCVVLGPFLSSATFSWGDHTLHFVLLAPAIGMIAITGGETAILKGQRKLGALALVQIVAALASLVISIPIYYFFWQAGIVPVIVLMAFVTMCATLWFSLRLFPLQFGGTYGILGEGMEMVRLGVAYTLAAVIGTASEMLIRSYLNVVGDLDVLGLYNAGYMLTITYAGMVFSAMETDYYPRLSAVQHDIRATNETVNRQMEVSLLLVSPMLAALIIALPVVVPLLFSQEFLPVVGMAQVAALAMYMKVLTLPVAYITLARGYSLSYLFLETSYFVAFVILIFFGYRYWGLFGTGVAITLAHVFEFLLVNAYAYKKYGYRSSATVYGYAIVQGALGLLAYILTLVADGYPYWAVGTLIVTLSGLLSLKALRH